MTNLRRETRRLALGFVASGSVTLGLGVLAVALPESTLVAAILTVGLISSLFGLNQIFSAWSVRAQPSGWRALLANGILMLVFGLLTVGATALPRTMAFGAVLLWLVVRAILALRIALRARLTKRIRYALVVSGTIDAAVAALMVAIPTFTIFQFLFFGAVYAVVFGASQIATGVVLRSVHFQRWHLPTPATASG